MRLDRDFYTKSATELAPLLLGKVICHVWNGEVIRGRITETESYMPNDTACHACKGKTNRNAPMYEIGGFSYVYLCYGMHFMFNVVSGDKDSPEAVLIRGIEDFNGPGRATKHLKIDKSLNNIDLVTSNSIWLEDDDISAPKYKAEKRIGIDYADAVAQNRLWRFIAIT